MSARGLARRAGPPAAVSKEAKRGLCRALLPVVWTPSATQTLTLGPGGALGQVLLSHARHVRGPLVALVAEVGRAEAVPHRNTGGKCVGGSKVSGVMG